MSVINKMLRDLDERRATSLGPGLRAGTQVVLAEPAGSTVSLLRIAQGISTVGLLVGVGAVGWWYLQEQTNAPAPLAAAAPAVAAPPMQTVSALPAASAASAASVAASAVEVAMPVAPAASEAVAVLPPHAALPVSTSSVPAPATLVAAMPVPAASAPPVVVTEMRQPPVAAAPKVPVVKAPSDRAGLQLTPSIWGGPPPVAPKAATVVPVAPVAPEPVVQAQRQQAAAREALVQAQGLYSGGSVDAAITLLQDALTGAERAAPPAPVAVQLSLVRELARMELAQGRAAAVLDMLGRVEPLLAGQADLWAVRANAAQRLGRHQETVQFYATALQTRPAEQRWLLGSAVSLAALGQLTQAAELAEKARAIGPVSKDVLGYLRQQGVALPDK